MYAAPFCLDRGARWAASGGRMVQCPRQHRPQSPREALNSALADDFRGENPSAPENSRVAPIRGMPATSSMLERTSEVYGERPAVHLDSAREG
jgi:hypothetical protein